MSQLHASAHGMDAFDAAVRMNGRSEEQVAQLGNLSFTDLYVRLDEPEVARYVIGENPERRTGLFPVPAEYSSQIEMVRTQVLRSEFDEGTIEFDNIRLRFCRADVSPNQQWASLRLIPVDLPMLDGLYMNPDATKVIRGWGARRGIVLIGGATGAGKTTTAVGALGAYLQARSEVAVAIEDPPEYCLQGEVGKGFCFQFKVDDETQWSEKVKAALRWRPRYILIGEIRTPAAAAQALRASTSGHLVLSTVHGGSVEEALGAVQRLAEVGLGSGAKMLLSDNLVGIVHQRLNAYGPDLQILETTTGAKAMDDVRRAILNGNLGGTKPKQFLAARPQA